jgi:hypothetical protein
MSRRYRLQDGSGDDDVPYGPSGPNQAASEPVGDGVTV